MKINISPDIIAAIIAGGVAVLTLLLNRWRDRKLQQRNIKEEKYITFLSSLILKRAGKDDKNKLIKSIQEINLVGSSAVVRYTSEFLKLMITKDNNEKEQNNNQDEKEKKREIKKQKQDEIYHNLVTAMRQDLYGRHANKGYPDKISLVIFDDEKNSIFSLNHPVLYNQYFFSDKCNTDLTLRNYIYGNNTN